MTQRGLISINIIHIQKTNYYIFLKYIQYMIHLKILCVNKIYIIYLNKILW
jgi:hypothetical protein